jgi:conjugal transfer pilus assembly protein TraB
MIHSQEEEKSLKKRRFLLMIVVVAFACFLGLIVWFNTHNYRQLDIRPVKFDFPSDKIDPNVIRIQNLESQLHVNDLENNQLKSTLTSMLKQMEVNQKIFVEQLDKQTEMLTHQIDQKIIKEKEEVLQEVNQKLKFHLNSFSPASQEITQADHIEAPFNRNDVNFWHREPLSFTTSTNPNSSSLPSEVPVKKMVRSLVSITCQSDQVSKKKFLNDSIPMGESVKAILLSGVDAVCGVYSRSEPVPVKLQLLEQGQLPNKMQSKIKRSVLLGSAYGDISSERVIIRLEKLRVLNVDGAYYDTAISGFVTGEDGKYGVRGKVVDRSAKMIKNAATSGALEEISNLAQASLAKPNVNVSSWSAAPQALGGGIVGGSSRALEMLADYYIKRAEHVQPVLQIDAGRIVDITFSFSVEIGDLDVKERIADIREQARNEEYNSL